MKIEDLKKLGFKKTFIKRKYYLRLTNPDFSDWFCDLNYYELSNSFYLEKVKLKIQSLSDLKKFISYFKT